MESRSSIPVAILARAKLTKVFCSLGNSLIVQFEDDSPFGFIVDRDVKLIRDKILDQCSLIGRLLKSQLTYTLAMMDGCKERDYKDCESRFHRL